jgi:hypothetical protein
VDLHTSFLFPKLWYLPVSPHSLTTQKTNIDSILPYLLVGDTQVQLVLGAFLQIYFYAYFVNFDPTKKACAVYTSVKYSFEFFRFSRERYKCPSVACEPQVLSHSCTDLHATATNTEPGAAASIHGREHRRN